MIDTHAHIYLEDFKEDIISVISLAKSKGITKILMPNISLDTILPMIDIESRFPNFCKSMIGLHPCNITKNYHSQLSELTPWFDKHKFIAIGEVGIDLYHSKELYLEQVASFEIQINWAKKFNLPLVIHARNSLNEIIDVLNKHQDGTLNGIIHCFSGTISQAQKVIDLGFKLGIGGVLTFKNSTLKDVVKQIDLRHLLLETDSPYLAPVPFRGKRNEPAHTYIIAKTLASIKEVDLATISLTTSLTAEKILGAL